MSAIHQFVQGPGVMLDPFWKNVEFLFQDAGANGNTAFVDRSKNNFALTTTAPAAATSTSPNFGRNGVALSGTSAIETADMPVNWVGGVPFTFELVFVRTGASGYLAAHILGGGTTWNGTGPQWMLSVYSGNVTLGYRYGTSTTPVNLSLTAPAVGVLTYVRVVHDPTASTVTLEVNGATVTSNGTNYPTNFVASGTARIRLGHCPGISSPSFSGALAGTIYAARWTRGLQRQMWAGHRTLPFPVHSGNANVAGPVTPESGQAVITGASWVVPAGITEISAVCIGRRMKVNGVTVLQAQNGALIGDGGGEGGQPSAESSFVETTYSDSGGGSFGGGGSTAIHTTYYLHGGGGGAGGYGANGGKGGNPPQAGTLGSGTGGQASRALPNGNIAGATPGQGASLRGLAGGGTLYGGGWANGNVLDPTPSRRGNALAWKNAIAVNAGDTITFEDCGVAPATVGSRIIWGAGRGFPDNAGDV